MNPRVLCVLALVAGFLTEGIVGQEPDPPPEQVVQAVQTITAYRWKAVEKEVPIEVMKRVRSWELEPYTIEIPQPGPQPADVDLCVPQCVPVGQSQVQLMEPYVGRTSVQVPFTNVQIGASPLCTDGRCGLVQGRSTSVNVNVGRRRGLFWRFRR